MLVNPSQERLRELALKYSTPIFKTYYKNVDKITRFKARSPQYSYIIGTKEDEAKYSMKTIDPKLAEELIKFQKEYMDKQEELIQIDGYYGLGEKRVGVRWIYSLAAANIAAMQQILSFPPDENFKPELIVYYTPELRPENMPGNVAMLVDMEKLITYVIGSDYFGESKKGALRMLNEYVYQRGGLVLHAGAKVVEIAGKKTTLAILGLSGTGKTTTTFVKHGDNSWPIQDDMISLWPDGTINITENGCFAKTFGLKEETEPVIYKGTIHPDAWLENVYMNPDGTLDFSKEILTPEEVEFYREAFIETGANPENVDAYIKGKVKAEEVVDEYGIPKDGWDFVVWTQNGRSVIPMSRIENVADFNSIPPLGSIGILNRDEGPDAATPGIVRFVNGEQAAGYFMLGETSKTSATGKERGKTRVPFTQPFFPRKHSLQAERFTELYKVFPDLNLWMMNTGYVGGDALAEKEGKALKVKIRHSKALVEAVLSGRIKWIKDPDFGYEIPDINAPENSFLLEQVPKEIIQPKLFFEKQGRLSEYEEWVKKIKKERKEFLEKHNVSPEIIKAVVGE